MWSFVGLTFLKIQFLAALNIQEFHFHFFPSRLVFYHVPYMRNNKCFFNVRMVDSFHEAGAKLEKVTMDKAVYSAQEGTCCCKQSKPSSWLNCGRGKARLSLFRTWLESSAGVSDDLASDSDEGKCFMEMEKSSGKKPASMKKLQVQNFAVRNLGVKNAEICTM